MARKQLTVEKRVAQEYRVWLLQHPNTPTARKFAAFNRIADKHFNRQDKLVA